MEVVCKCESKKLWNIVHGPIIQEHEEEVAKILGKSDFKAQSSRKRRQTMFN